MRLLIAFCFYFGGVLGSLSAQDLDTQIQKARLLVESMWLRPTIQVFRLRLGLVLMQDFDFEG